MKTKEYRLFWKGTMGFGYSPDHLFAKLTPVIQGVATDNNVVLMKLTEEPNITKRTGKGWFTRKPYEYEVKDSYTLDATFDITQLDDEQVHAFDSFEESLTVSCSSIVYVHK